MKKIYLFLIALTIVGCGAPQKHVWKDDQSFSNAKHKDSHTGAMEPRFSDDPLLDSVYRARYLECLEKCSKCEK
jgi:DNA-binding MltR family transcriptional regulator